jgi:hypothetical protein
MPDGNVEALEAQLTAVSDTQRNVAGLVEKAAGIQGDLLSAGFTDFSNAVGEPFAALSSAAEQLQALAHDMEIERNRIRNEAD